MRPHTATPANLAFCESQCPGYAELIEPAIVERSAGRIVIDLDHPAARAAGKARAAAVNNGGRLHEAGRVAKSGLRAAASVAKTAVGIDRLPEVEVEARLAVCRKCPGDHAVFKKGKLHTCGPMLKSMREKRRKTCGCVLRKKALDRRQDCPFGYWAQPCQSVDVELSAAGTAPDREAQE